VRFNGARRVGLWDEISSSLKVNSCPKSVKIEIAAAWLMEAGNVGYPNRDLHL